VLCSKTLEWTEVGEVGRALSLMGREAVRIPPRIERSAELAPARLAAAAGQIS
jgi:hypothetical protein